MTNREWLNKEFKNLSDDEVVELINGKYLCKIIGKEFCYNSDTCNDCIYEWLKEKRKDEKHKGKN